MNNINYLLFLMVTLLIPEIYFIPIFNRTIIKTIIMRISTYYFLSSTLALLSTAVHGCAMFEFFDWVNLPDDVKAAAEALGYDAVSWETVRANPVEHVGFDTLMATGIEGGLTADQTQEALMKLDLFDEEGVCWDFHINHYGGYDWAALDGLYTPFGQNVQDTVATIGWDEATWNSDETTGPIPESECGFWITLDPIIKWAYYSLGWNPLEFDTAQCDPRCPKSLACPFNE